jgi:hypothetical protein
VQRDWNPCLVMMAYLECFEKVKTTFIPRRPGAGFPTYSSMSFVTS